MAQELLGQCHAQWAKRPADERFWTLDEMYTATNEYYGNAVLSTDVDMKSLVVVAHDDELGITGREGRFARFNHHSFGQFASRVHAPAGYLRTLSPQLAGNCLNYNLARETADLSGANLLMRKEGEDNQSLRLRALVTEKYTRIWDRDIVKRLIPLQEHGWRVPPAMPAGNDNRVRKATKEDVMACSLVKEGENISPSGLYASDSDMFAFMVNPGNPIEDKGPDGKVNALYRGFFVENSEVGDCCYSMTFFLFNTICWNNNILGARDLTNLRIRHVGTADIKAFKQMEVELTQYNNLAASVLEQHIVKARTHMLAADLPGVIDLIFGKLKLLTKDEVNVAYHLSAIHPEDSLGASPNSAWGFAQGVTRLSQDTAYANARVSLDRAAGKIMQMAF